MIQTNRILSSDENVISPEFLASIYEEIQNEQFSSISELLSPNNELFIDDFDAEGIFHQIKSHNAALLPLQEDAEDVHPNTLSASAFACELLLKEAFGSIEDCNSEQYHSSSESDSENQSFDAQDSADEDFDNDAQDSTDEDLDNDAQDSTDEDLDNEAQDGANEDLDTDIGSDSDDVAESVKDNDEENDSFGSDIDFDADTFGDLKLDENEDSHDEQEDEMNGFENREELVEKSKVNKKKKPSKVLDESVLASDMFDKEVEIDEELLDALYESDDDNDASDEGASAKFKDFFHTEESYSEYVKDALKKQNTKEVENESEGSDVDFEEFKKQSEVQSTFEKEQHEQKQIIDEMEKKNVSEKPWFLTGEVVKSARPDGSAIEEYLETIITLRPETEITETFNDFIEKKILSRFKNKAFDDIERVEKATIDCQKFKKSLALNSEKSQKSLADLYAEDYANTLAQAKPKKKINLLTGKEEDDTQEKEEQQKFTKELDDAFRLLDALFNYHYTPALHNPEIKAVNMLPAITMEEPTPITASDATVLAPEEIFSSVRGELIGSTERTKTDKKRERRKKKSFQHQKSLAENEKLNKQLKNTSRDGMASTDASIKFVKNAVKAGQIHVLERSTKKSASNAFLEIKKGVGESQKRKKTNNDFKLTKKQKKNQVK